VQYFAHPGCGEAPFAKQISAIGAGFSPVSGIDGSLTFLDRAAARLIKSGFSQKILQNPEKAFRKMPIISKIFVNSAIFSDR